MIHLKVFLQTILPNGSNGSVSQAQWHLFCEFWHFWWRKSALFWHIVGQSYAVDSMDVSQRICTCSFQSYLENVYLFLSKIFSILNQTAAVMLLSLPSDLGEWRVPTWLFMYAYVVSVSFPFFFFPLYLWSHMWVQYL